jgi:acetolactate synthase-1/2/3 large subunit
VVFIVGDGTFNYNPVPGGLGVLQEHNLSVLIIILNNAGYIAMSQGYHRHFPEGWAAGHKKYLGVEIEPLPDYVKLAEAFGAYGEKIEAPEDLEPALKRAFKELAQGRSVLLDVIMETS